MTQQREVGSIQTLPPALASIELLIALPEA